MKNHPADLAWRFPGVWGFLSSCVIGIAGLDVIDSMALSCISLLFIVWGGLRH